ncbi:MAG: methyltransferase family protein [Paracoccaceae bacterium]
MKSLDYPPVWLAGFLAIAWALAWLFPHTVATLPFMREIAVLVLVAGSVLMALAIIEMRRAKTTIEPRRDPTALVTSGVFRRSRNPIYLGFLLILGAGILWWGSISAIPLMWVFPMVIGRRFIDDEEIKMQQFFGKGFEAWSAKTKRWW